MPVTNGSTYHSQREKSAVTDMNTRRIIAPDNPCLGMSTPSLTEAGRGGEGRGGKGEGESAAARSLITGRSATGRN